MAEKSEEKHSTGTLIAVGVGCALLGAGVTAGAFIYLDGPKLPETVTAKTTLPVGAAGK